MHTYLLFHKPYGVLSQFSGDGGRPTLRDFIAIPDVYPVGRLDHDSEGLMLLTDDGPLQHQLSDPKFAHPRTYWVQVEGEITDGALDQLRKGVAVQDYVSRPAQVRRIPPPPVPPRNPPIRVRQSIPDGWIALTLTEGRNRQVRRMTAAVGFPTLRLIRCAIGELALADLAPGGWRHLTPAELKALLPKSVESRKGPAKRSFRR